MISCIRPIGQYYSYEDELVDTVELHKGFTVIHANTITTYKVGDKFRDGIIVDCFEHPESDCIWMIVECNGTYFDVGLEYTEYIITQSNVEHIKDSTELSGGHLW